MYLVFTTKQKRNKTCTKFHTNTQTHVYAMKTHKKANVSLGNPRITTFKHEFIHIHNVSEEH